MALARNIERSNTGTAPLGNAALLAAMSAALLVPAAECMPAERLVWSFQASANTSLGGLAHWTISRTFVPKTGLARRLLALRNQIAEAGGLQPASAIIESLAASRSI